MSDPKPLKSKQERRQEIVNAIDRVVSMDATPDKESLRNLLIITAQMENSFGYDSSAYGRSYTNSFMSIDGNALDALYEQPKDSKGNTLPFTAKGLETQEKLKNFGYANKEQFQKALKEDDPFASILAARLYYANSPQSLPQNDFDGLYDYYSKEYNKSGMSKYHDYDQGKERARNIRNVFPIPQSSSAQKLNNANQESEARYSKPQELTNNPMKGLTGDPIERVTNSPMKGLTNSPLGRLNPTQSPSSIDNATEDNYLDYNTNVLENTGPNKNYGETINPSIHPNTKMAEGGSINYGGLANIGMGFLDQATQSNDPEKLGFMQTAGGSALSGAASGAAAGSVIGPWGTAAGAIIGGVSGFMKGKKNKDTLAANKELSKPEVVKSAAAIHFNNYQGTKIMAKGGPINNTGPRSKPLDNYMPIDGSRPSYTNKEGMQVSENKVGFGIGNKEYLLPTTINGKQLSDDEALDHYLNTGEHMGKFDSIEESDRASMLRTFMYNDHPSFRKKMADGGHNKSAKGDMTFKGKTHAQGGIYIGNNVEVEDGEEMWEDFIFSNRF